jgi:multiple sugar transport system permease protein
MTLTAPETAPPAERAAPGRPRSALARRLVPYGYLSPTVLLVVVLMVVPIVMVISYSFRDNVIVQENSVFAGLANYTKVLTDADFLAALRNTAVFISVSTVAHLLLGLGFAMMLNTQLLSGVTKAIFRIVYILPWLFTIAVIAVIWRLLLDPSGVVNYVLQSLGAVQEGVDWLGDPGKALWAVTFVNIWSG